MREFIPIFALLLIVSEVFSISPVFAEENVLKPTIILSVKTDQGYYSPGDLIRVRGTITNSENEPINATLQFSFQEMNKTISSGLKGKFLTTVPSSPTMPENLYKMDIVARSLGYLDKYLTIPVVIMSEPSSLAPERVIPDDFLHL